MCSDLFLATDVRTETPPLDSSGGVCLSSRKVLFAAKEPLNKSFVLK